MNCPQCGNRNPSTAKRCLHCNFMFVEEKESLLGSDNETGGSSNVFIIVVVVAGVIIFGSMFLFGADTYDVKCTHSEAEAKKLEQDPAWERNRSAETTEQRHEAQKYKKRTGKNLPRSAYGFVRCYQIKTGHIDGVME